MVRLQYPLDDARGITTQVMPAADLHG